MFDFGDELVVNSYRVPWLLWIQLLVLILIVFLLYCFSLVSLDLLESNTATASSSSCDTASPSNLGESIIKHGTSNSVTHVQNFQVRENQSMKGHIATSSVERVVVEGDTGETEGSASHLVFHPCHYFRLAKSVFLKCFGMDSDSVNLQPDNTMKNKDD